MDKDDAEKTLIRLFEQLKIKAEIKQCVLEGNFLVFDITLKPGGIFRRLEQFSTEIALSLKAFSEPLIYPITKDGIIRMEITISEPENVYFNDIISSEKFRSSKANLPLALGKSRNGDPLIVDLSKMPHLLIGGTTGSGKSIALQTIINSLLINEKQFINFALIDTKRVEFSYYDSLSQLYGPVARDVDGAMKLLENLVAEMEKRFSKLEKAGVRDINSYKGRMPYIVVVIDEFADLMMVSKKATQEYICRLAQKSRACGIHLVIATQRPEAGIITGLIKSNLPSRLSCKVSSQVDSRILLDRNGAENLSGNGDSIISCHECEFTRFKGSYISEENITLNLKNKKSWWSRVWNS
jgi:S-DNA-T family DNA segregation ATPase FtsK/SpoIIIE